MKRSCSFKYYSQFCKLQASGIDIDVLIEMFDKKLDPQFNKHKKHKSKKGIMLGRRLCLIIRVCLF